MQITLDKCTLYNFMNAFNYHRAKVTDDIVLRIYKSSETELASLITFIQADLQVILIVLLN